MKKSKLSVRLVALILSLITTFSCLLSSMSFSVGAVTDNEKKVYNFFKNTMGFNAAGIAGVVANIWWESGFDPNIIGDEGTSYGICQWHNSRWDNLKTFCNNKGYDWKTIEGQLWFLKHELETGYPKMLAEMKAAQNTGAGAYNVAYTWCYTFERPADTANMSNKRGLIAKDKYWPAYSANYTYVLDGVYRFKNKATGKYLAVKDSIDAQSQNVELSASQDKGSGFIIAETVNHIYNVQPLCSGKRMLNVYGSSVSDGLNVCIYDKSGDLSQQWFFQKVAAGYIIRSAANDSCVLEPINGDVKVKTYTGANSQIWELSNITNYSVSYNTKGGSTPPAAQAKSFGKSITLSGITPTKTGYSFLGWSTNPNATTASYKPGAVFNEDGYITLYAVWKANTYTISFNANGGEGAPANQTKTHDSPLALTTAVPTKKNFDFVGWATSQTATEPEFTPGALYNLEGNKTLYAVWKNAVFYIEYSGEKGEGFPEKQTCIIGENATISTKVPTRQGFIFMGWTPIKDGTVVEYEPGKSYLIQDNLLLYALWKAEPCIGEGGTGHIWHFVSYCAPASCTNNGKAIYKCEKCETEEELYLPDSETETPWLDDIPTCFTDEAYEAKTFYKYGNVSEKSEEWLLTNRSTVQAAQFPSGYFKNNALYTTYNNDVTNKETDSSKKVFTKNPQAIGYIYWHWCSSTYKNTTPQSLEIARTYGEPSTSKVFEIFHAFFSTTYVPYDPKPDATKFVNAAACARTFWWQEPIPVYEYDCTDWIKNSGDWQEEPLAAVGNLTVESKTQYKFNLKAKGHTYENGYCTVCLSEDPDYFKPGDINRDKKVNAIDANELISFIIIGGTEEQKQRCDLNLDNKVNALDALSLKTIILST